MKHLLLRVQGDLFGGLNDGLLSRAEALAAVDIGKHQASSTPGLPQLKHDMMYHHSMGAPHPGAPNTRPHQVTASDVNLYYLIANIQ
jgi:class 4 POU domain transcription factor